MKIIDAEGRDVTQTPGAMIEPTGRIFLSRLPNMGTAITLVSNTAYFAYLGRMTETVLLQYVEFYVNTAGAGAQTAEVGIFSTAGPANKTNQGTNGITKLTATGTVDSLVSIGVKRNTSAFNFAIPAGTYLWAGIRTAMATSQPALAGVCMDVSQGLVLSTAGAGALTNAGPWSGSVIALGTYMNSAVAPDLRGTLD